MSELVLEKDLPNGWASTQIRDIVTLINGKAFKPEDWSTKGLPIVRIQNLNDPNKKFNYCDFEVDKKFLIDTGQLLFAWSGTPGTSFGSFIWKGGKAVLNQHIFRVEINEKLQDKKYLLYAMNQNLNKYIAKAHGTAGLAHITKGMFEEEKILLPPLNEQKRIVAKIEELFSLISNITNLLENSEKQINLYEKVLIFNALSGNVTKDWRKMHPNLNGNDTLSKIFEERRKFLGKKYVEIEPEIQNTFTIPKLWRWTSLNNISKKIVDGTHHTPIYTESGIPFLSVKDIKNDQIDFNDCKFISKEDHNELIKRCNPEFNDILITKSGTIGRTAVVNTNKPFSLFVSVALIKIFDRHLNPYYLNYVLKNFMNHIDISQKIKGGVIKNFHLEDLRLVPVPIPHLEEQKEIVDILDIHMKIINNYKKSVDGLKQKIEVLKSSILKTAFEGKLVPQDPNDEPAEILLQKIKQEKQKIINSKPRRKKNDK